MKRNLSLIVKAIFITLFVFVSLALAQSGGNYELTQTVTATGSVVSGGAYSMTFTAGQPFAGSLPPSGNKTLHIGFWTPPDFAPTAANVTISGRVLTAGGQGVRNTVLTLTDSSGMTRIARTSGFGYYRFEDVPSGEIYVLTISSKRFVFGSPTRVLNVQEALSDIDFIAETENQLPNLSNK